MVGEAAQNLRRRSAGRILSRALRGAVFDRLRPNSIGRRHPSAGVNVVATPLMQ